MRPSIRTTVGRCDSEAILQKLQPQLSRVVVKAAHDVEARAKAEILNGQKSGHIYGKHQASAPGESPANDLGNLAAAIRVGPGDGPLSRTVASHAEYSETLEKGSTDGKIAARPFLGPALESVRQPFVRAVRRVIRNGA